LAAGLGFVGRFAGVQQGADVAVAQAVDGELAAGHRRQQRSILQGQGIQRPGPAAAWQRE
jgi:hypothetical protein